MVNLIFRFESCSIIRAGVGYPATHTELCRCGVECEIENEPERASKVARDKDKSRELRLRTEQMTGLRTLISIQTEREVARRALAMVAEVNRQRVLPYRAAAWTSCGENRVVLCICMTLNEGRRIQKKRADSTSLTEGTTSNLGGSSPTNGWSKGERVRGHHRPRRSPFSPRGSPGSSIFERHWRAENRRRVCQGRRGGETCVVSGREAPGSERLSAHTMTSQL